MRYNECGDKKYFEVYEDCARMLVLFDHDKVLGRAILWDVNQTTYMDRVYVCRDYLVDVFIQYAIEHKWCYREHQSLMDEYICWYDPSDNYSEKHDHEIIIKLPKRYSKMPYVDTICYYRDNCLYNWEANDTERLSSTEGHYSDEYDIIICPNCGTECGLENQAHYCFYGDIDAYLCENCCRYIGGEGCWVANDEPTKLVNINGTFEEFTSNYIDTALVPNNELINYCPYRAYFISIDNILYLYRPEWFNWNEEKHCYEPK